MSLKKSATRRLGLLAGSSLVAVGLGAAAFIGAALAPVAAQAYDECAAVAPTVSDGVNGVSDPSLNSAVADTFTCTGATAFQTTGVTYTSQGNLTVNATGTINVGTVGIDLTGATTDNVVFNANGALTGLSGPVIDIKSASGNITATTAGITATAAGVSNAVRLESTGAGNITYTKTGTNAAAAIHNTAVGADAAISAITHGGNIVMNVASGSPTSAAVGTGINGRLRGILAQTSGAGSVTLNIAGFSGVTASAIDGVAAVDIVSGSGGAVINLTTGGMGGRTIAASSAIPVPFTDALAVRVVSAGAVRINNTQGKVVGPVDFSGVTAGGVRFENLGTGFFFAGSDFSDGGTWHASGDSIFSSQNDLLIMGGAPNNNAAPNTTIDFGGGTDTFNMSGILLSNGMTITNLEILNNSGSIFLGGGIKGNSGDTQRTDNRADDRLSVHGATYTGSGTGRVVLDVILNGVAQVGCETLTGAGDCLDLRDGTTAGSTVIALNDASPDSMLSGYTPDGITLVDVSGSGASAAAHFTLAPASTNGYVNPLYGAAIQRPGAFVYVLRYDAENQRHVLVSQPRDRNLFDYAILSGAAQSIWHLTAETVTDRQTDLRDGTEGGSVWLRTSGEVTRRDTEASFVGWDDTYTFDNSYKLYAGTIMGGIDLLSGASGAFDYVLGAQIGYVSSSFDMEESESSGRFTGATGGAYGSLWSDGLFLDTAVNLNGLTLDFQHPALGSKTTTFVNSVGAKAEGGARAPITAGTFAEPLLTLAWVRTTFEEISLAPGEVQPDDAQSLRGALGLRLGGALDGQTVGATYFVTGRAWNEFEGQSSGVVHNPGVDLPFTDEFTGLFGQAEAGVNVYNTDNTLSGFLTSGVKFKDGYSAVDLSLGVRMAW